MLKIAERYTFTKFDGNLQNDSKKCIHCGSKIMMKNGFVKGQQCDTYIACGKQFISREILDKYQI